MTSTVKLGVDDATADVPVPEGRSETVPEAEPYFERMVKYVRWYLALPE